MSDPAQRRVLVLCLATVYFVWGTTYLATRVGVLNLPPFLFGGLRFLASGLLLVAAAVLWQGFRPAQLAGQWWHLHVLALLGVALCNGLQVWAMQWVQSNTSALLNASSALWIVVFGLFGARAHRPDARAIAGLAIGFAGVALLLAPSLGGEAAGSAPLLPLLGILASCVIWSLGTIYMRNHSLDVPILALVGMQMLIGGAWLTLAGWLHGDVGAWRWSRAGALALVYLTIFSSCFAYTAYAWLARHATPAQTGTYSYVNPAIAAVVGYLVLGEQLTPVQGLGAVVILAGVLLINWPGRRALRPAP